MHLVQTDHLIPDRRPNLLMIKKRVGKRKEETTVMDITVPAEHRLKIIESE